jgi:hypothetical protein
MTRRDKQHLHQYNFHNHYLVDLFMQIYLQTRLRLQKHLNKYINIGLFQPYNWFIGLNQPLSIFGMLLARPSQTTSRRVLRYNYRFR